GHDEGHHRARYARRVLACGPGDRPGSGTHHRRRQARRRQEGPGRPGSVSGRSPLMDAMIEPDTRIETKPAYFSVRDIHAYYGESYIVQGVSFDIDEGDIVALLGRNGAGKTSTL